MNKTNLTFRPLYEQVREAFLQRLIDGTWPPGMLLPSEQRLAAELGVSQGTVRKALDEMTAADQLVRRQGRGTYVAEPKERSLLFKFFQLVSDSGDRLIPESADVTLSRVAADKATKAALGLEQRSQVWRIERTRLLEGQPVIVEQISLSTTRFPDLDKVPLPNNLYVLYSSRYGLTIARAEERLRAVLATKAQAERLGCEEGTPLLSIERTAFGLDGSSVERRLSFCLTNNFHYSSVLG